MAWQCYMVEYWPAAPGFWREVHPDNKPWDELRPPTGLLQFDDLRPGAMWWEDGELCVKLPSGSEWNIDRGRNHPNNKEIPKWTRTGTAPNVTAMPSIDHRGRYHGWLRDGVLTDDCEGRTFPQRS